MAEDFREVPNESTRKRILTRLPNSPRDPEPFDDSADLLVFCFPEDL